MNTSGAVEVERSHCPVSTLWVKTEVIATEVIITELIFRVNS